MPAVFLRKLLYIAFCLFLLSVNYRITAADQFANPLDVRLADPHVLLDNGVYYLYATSAGNGYKVWTSSDLVNWRDRGLAFRTTSSSWAKNRFWAPEVIKHQGKYYLFYSAGGGPDDVMRICVASATSPLGPFADIAAPLFDNGQSYIDAHCFIDTDGQAYLYCSQDMSAPADNKSETVVARLNSTFTGLSSGITLCITPDNSWEIAGGGFKWNEAPAVLKRGGYYYMLYSGNVYSSPNYAIGYATATTPFGPWTKYSGNPIVKKTATVSGPGHCSVTTSPDGQEQWLVYHTHQQLSGGGQRQLAIDRISFENQIAGPARLMVPGAPSETMQAAPSGAAPFPVGGSDEFITGPGLDRTRWTVFNEDSSSYLFSSSALVISTVDGDVYADSRANHQNIFLQYPPWEDFEATTKVNFAPAQDFEQASLFVWQDHNNFIRFSNASIFGQKSFEIAVETNANYASQVIAHNFSADFWLRIKKTGSLYVFYASANGSTWSLIGAPRTVNLIDRKIGFGAASPGSGRRLSAAFDYFRVESGLSSVDAWSLY